MYELIHNLGVDLSMSRCSRGAYLVYSEANLAPVSTVFQLWQKKTTVGFTTPLTTWKLRRIYSGQKYGVPEHRNSLRTMAQRMDLESLRWSEQEQNHTSPHKRLKTPQESDLVSGRAEHGFTITGIPIAPVTGPTIVYEQT